MCGLLSALSGVTLVSAEEGWINLHLEVSLPVAISDKPSSSRYTLKIAVDPLANNVGPILLDPAHVAFDDILAVQHPQKLTFLARILSA